MTDTPKTPAPPEDLYVCNKCGYAGPLQKHEGVTGCRYFAAYAPPLKASSPPAEEPEPAIGPTARMLASAMYEQIRQRFDSKLTCGPEKDEPWWDWLAVWLQRRIAEAETRGMRKAEPPPADRQSTTLTDESIVGGIAPGADPPHETIAERLMAWRASLTPEQQAAFDALAPAYGCRWCLAGYPANPSSIGTGKFVHNGTPVGRVLCGVQEADDAE